jgi:hypothetical protein
MFLIGILGLALSDTHPHGIGALALSAAVDLPGWHFEAENSCL